MIKTMKSRLKFSKLRLLFLSLIVCCQVQAQTQLDLHQKMSTIANYLHKLAKQDAFSGAILIAKDGKVLLEKAYNYAHLGFKVPNTVDTKFGMASMGKMFTSIAIMQLVEQGKLSLQDKVGKVLPKYPNKRVKEEVTIHHLLTHTSGMPNFMTEDFYKTSKDHYRKLDDFSPLYQTKPLLFSPGKRFSYTNSGYLVLGLIIEKLSGEKYDEYLRKHIFEVAQMKNTGNYDTDHPIANLAEGYTLSDVYPLSLKNNRLMGAVRGGPAGGGYTTLQDMFLFAQALQNQLFLSKKNVEILTTPKSGNKNWGYGYGFQYFGPNKQRVVGHSGGHWGVGSELRIFTELGYTVVLLTNRDLDAGFLEARYFIQDQLVGITSTTRSYFFTKKVLKTIEKKGVEAGKKVKKTAQVKLSERDINAKGYQLLKQKKYSQAIDVFIFEVFAFPRSFDAYDSLGEAYMESGNIPLAIKNYKKSLELNPKNENAIKKLAKMKIK
ncbi:hypothetical protein BKI52_05250 [marine bacterium AO1-C]|nr:hypothetical protein BKI52_05250 [marine bacterium AO1-C]